MEDSAASAQEDSDVASGSDTDSSDSSVDESEHSEGGGGSESEGEDCESGDETLFPSDPVDDGLKHHWNTPEGWAKVSAAIEEYMKIMSDHGHTCAVCGERKQKTKLWHQDKILLWNIAADRAELEDVLYTQYPCKTHKYDVSWWDITIVLMHSKPSFGCVRGALLRDNAGSCRIAIPSCAPSRGRCL